MLCSAKPTLSLCAATLSLSLSAHDAAVRFNALDSVLHEGGRASCWVPTDRHQHQQQGGEVTVVICQCRVIKDTGQGSHCVHLNMLPWRNLLLALREDRSNVTLGKMLIIQHVKVR